jgi:hypothetical protein
MAISEADIKLLWGRAAGICSNPSCRADLTRLIEGGDGYNVGEMAHVIARREKGRRGEKGGGPDTYANLILLCPTCHTDVDKAPEGAFPAELLHRWKSEHEAQIRRDGRDLQFTNLVELKRFVARKLRENKAIYEQFGPRSVVAQGDPLSNAVEIWRLKKLSTMVPNNRAIVNAIDANIELLQPRDEEVFLLFKNHAESWEQNQYTRLDSYPLFPEEFGQEFSNV